MKKIILKFLTGDDNWKNLKIAKSDTYKWSMSSTYIKKPPLELERDTTKNELKARPLLILGDSITTDHISPAGVIKEDSGRIFIAKTS